jgi:pyruvate/2-oxoglutarate dehydrogenase complex dihydrolipoamide acyltransferase (E2) component
MTRPGMGERIAPSDASAPFDGTVAQLNVREGGQVSEGTLLVKIEKGEGA